MGATDPCYCRTCGKEWDRDPCLDVTCPTCGADPGTLCRRPSGHLVWDQRWSGLPKGIHPERDIEAVRKGAYGTCPRGVCPESIEEIEGQAQSDEQATFTNYA